MSMPGQKLFPAPVTTIAPIRWSASARSARSNSSCSSSKVHALCRSGRFKVSTATAPRTS